MKTIRFKHSVLATCAALALASVSMNSARAQLVINQFDASSEVTSWGAGNGSTVTWDSAVDAGGGMSPGSMHVTCPFTNVGNSWQEGQITKYVNANPINIGSYINIEFDVKVDTAHSSTSLDGNYGWVRWVIQGGSGWAWSPFGQTSITNNGTGWQHVSASLAGIPSPAQTLIIDFNTSWNAYPTNTISYWVDNVQMTSPPLPLPTLAAPVEAPQEHGLTMLPAYGQWTRDMIYPVGTAFGWWNAGQAVSYSFTITNFPACNDYCCKLYLIPNIDMKGENAADTAVDWDCTNQIAFTITANTDNPATNWNVEFTTKTNMTAVGSNPDAPDRMTFNYPKLPVGTWTVRFNNNSNIDVLCPDASYNTNFTLPPDVASYVSGNGHGDSARMTPYFGFMPRVNANEAEAAVMGSITIKKGSTVLVTDNFSGSTLDTGKWSNLDGINTIYNGDLAYYLSWNTPNDQGFAALQTASSLNGSWNDLSTAANWLFINGNHTVPVTKSGLQAQLGETDVAFFRLVKRVFTKLQILLPGMTTAPNTVSGYTGAPIAQHADPGDGSEAFNVIVNSVDANWNAVNASDTIHLSSTDAGNFLVLDIPADMSLSGGSATFSVVFLADGSATITATDTTDISKTLIISPTVTY